MPDPGMESVGNAPLFAPPEGGDGYSWTRLMHKYYIVRVVSSSGVPDMKYLGCWIDNPHKRILSEFYSNRRKGGIDWYNIGESSVLGCAKDAIATGKQYNLMAVQFYGECWSQEGNPDYKKMRAAPHACKLGTYCRITTAKTFSGLAGLKSL